MPLTVTIIGSSIAVVVEIEVVTTIVANPFIINASIQIAFILINFSYWLAVYSYCIFIRIRHPGDEVILSGLKGTM